MLHAPLVAHIEDMDSVLAVDGGNTKTISLVLTGGVLRHPSALPADAIVERVRVPSPEARPVVAR